MTPRDALWVAAISTSIVALGQAFFGTITYLLERRPRRPPPPDIFLPDGWQKWYPDGRGNMRMYEWHNRRWCEQRHRRVKVEELADD